jgi:hypothetical protein
MCLNSVTVQFLLAAHFTLRFIKYFSLLVYVLVEVVTDNVRNFLIAEYLCHDILLAFGDELLKMSLELGVFYLSDLLRSFVNSFLHLTKMAEHFLLHQLFVDLVMILEWSIHLNKNILEIWHFAIELLAFFSDQQLLYLLVPTDVSHFELVAVMAQDQESKLDQFILAFNFRKVTKIGFK